MYINLTTAKAILAGMKFSYLQKNIMNPAIRKNAKKKSLITKDTTVHSGYNEKNPTQTQGAFKPDTAEQAPKKDIDNKDYKTDAEVQKKEPDSEVIKRD